MHSVVKDTMKGVRRDRPVHLLGIGGISDIFHGVCIVLGKYRYNMEYMPRLRAIFDPGLTDCIHVENGAGEHEDGYMSGCMGCRVG